VSSESLRLPSFQSLPPDLLKRLTVSSGELYPIFGPDFIPDPTAAKIRPSMSEIQNAILALANTGFVKGENILVSRTSFVEALRVHNISGHLSEIHHVYKPDDPLGRLCYDYSNISSGVPVNGSPNQADLIRQRMIDIYGKLTYPSVCDYIEYFWSACAHFPGQTIQIAKTDISRCYHRLRWSPEGSMLMALLIAPDLVLIPLTPGFGKNEVPYMWGPWSDYFDFQHLQRNLKRGISVPFGATFVDDNVTAGPFSYLQEEVQDARVEIRSVVSPDAVHPTKGSQSCCEDVIGTRFDTNNHRGGLTQKGYFKLVFFFFVVLPEHLDTTTMLALSVVQALASLSYHYGKVIPLLRFTASTFWPALRNPSSNPRSLNHRQLNSIQLWRDYLRFAFGHSDVLSTTLLDLYYNDPIAGPSATLPSKVFYVFSDASPHYLGLFIPRITFCQIAVADFLEASQSSLHIAHLEFIAFIAAYLISIQYSAASSHIHIYIDNTNAKGWSTGNINTCNPIANTLTTINCLLQTSFARIQTRSYIRSEDNRDADAISRNRFSNSDQLPESRPSNILLQYFKDWLSLPDSAASRLLPSLPTPQDCDDSVLFYVL
jgi:hypothetical protein